MTCFQQYNGILWYVACSGDLPRAHVAPVKPGLHLHVFGAEQEPCTQAEVQIAVK